MTADLSLCYSLLQVPGLLNLSHIIVLMDKVQMTQ